MTDRHHRNAQGPGEFLLSIMDPITRSSVAVEELIDVAGRVTLNAVPKLSALQVVGEPGQGGPEVGKIGWHGTSKRPCTPGTGSCR